MASSLTTASARDMLEVLIGGERDPRVLADLARGVMRKKILDLSMALAGRFRDLGADYFTRPDSPTTTRRKDQLLRELQALGYTVQIIPAA